MNLRITRTLCETDVLASDAAARLHGLLRVIGRPAVAQDAEKAAPLLGLSGVRRESPVGKSRAQFVGEKTGAARRRRSRGAEEGAVMARQGWSRVPPHWE